MFIFKMSINRCDINKMSRILAQIFSQTSGWSAILMLVFLLVYFHKQQTLHKKSHRTNQSTSTGSQASTVSGNASITTTKVLPTLTMRLNYTCVIFHILNILNVASTYAGVWRSDIAFACSATQSRDVDVDNHDTNLHASKTQILNEYQYIYY